MWWLLLNGTVYAFFLTRDEREPASLVDIDPYTYRVILVFNSKFRLELHFMSTPLQTPQQWGRAPGRGLH